MKFLKRVIIINKKYSCFFFRLAGGSTELSSDLATHCVLELPAESGDLPNGLVDLDVISGVLSKIEKKN